MVFPLFHFLDRGNFISSSLAPFISFVFKIAFSVRTSRLPRNMAQQDRFSTLSYRELQEESKRANIKANDKADTLRKKLRAREASHKEVEKAYYQPPRSKRPKRDPAADLICPITLELPFAPVTAADGRVYEKSAIETYIKRTQKKGRILKSPITNEIMGEQLLPAPQHKNTIEALIETGVISGTLAKSWNERVFEKKRMEETLKKADQGDIKAMQDVAGGYFWGVRGFPKNQKIAFTWYVKAHDAGSVFGTACMGALLCWGSGVEADTKKGIMYISIAAGQGSDFAALELGMALADGAFGVAKNPKEAIRWLQKYLTGNCTDKKLPLDKRTDALKKLAELQDAED